MQRVLALLALSLLLAGPRAACADDWPYPAGQSIQRIEERKVVLVLPAELSADVPASLLVVLHGAGGTATGMAGSFAGWAQDGYVVCAVKALDMTWEPDDLTRVRTIVAHLKEVLPIDPKKVHGVGYSNGGWNLAPVVFDDEVHACSATWIAAGYDGHRVPRWAAKEMGVIALAGTEDANVRSARDTVPRLTGKVRSVEVRTEEGLGHAFPRTLMPYLRWWMGVQEGRFVPGDDLGFEWKDDVDAAVASLAGERRGGVFVWLYSAEDVDNEHARVLQHEVLFDPDVRFFGTQLRCVKLDVMAHAERAAEWGVKKTPAVVVLDRKGKVKKKYEGKITSRKLASALKGVAPVRRRED